MDTKAAKPRGVIRLVFGLILLVFLLGCLWIIDKVAGRFYGRLAPLSGQAAVHTLLVPSHTGARGFFVQHPFLYYTFHPNSQVEGVEQFNSWGHRNPEVTPEPEPGVLRLMAIGGSTTASFPYVPNSADAWPLRTAAYLREDLKVNVEAINAGLTAANSADSLSHYAFRNRYFKPHVVVLYMCGNDDLALMFPDYHPEYTHYIHGWKLSALVGRPFERTLLRSNLAKFFYAWWLRELSLDADLGRDSITIWKPDDANRFVATNEPTGFRRNLDTMLTLIRKDGAVPVLFTVSYAPEGRFRQHRDYGKYYDAMIAGWKKDVAVMQELAKEYGVMLVTLPEDALDEARFLDFCHTDTEGDRIKAQFLADALAPVISSLNTNGQFNLASRANQ